MTAAEMGRGNDPETPTGRRNLYREYTIGDRIPFTLQTLHPDGTVKLQDREIIIEDVRGGGFFGKVLIPIGENFVVKTSLPDPWHDLWRIINWDHKPFPAQVDETEAQLEHIATRLIQAVLPVLTHRKFYSPASFGYTKLATGYAQVNEQMIGRGPRFDLSIDEFRSFRQAQKELLDLGLKLGLEQIGQIHPDNPFGMANLWFDDKTNRWIWLDTTAAIPHKGFIKPWYHFAFHEDIRKAFHTDEPTFNRIHTDRFFAHIYNNRFLFRPDLFEQVFADLRLYASLQEKKRSQEAHNASRGAARKAAQEVAHDVFTENTIYKLIADPLFRKEKLETLIRIMKDPAYRAFFFNKNVALRGVERAKQEGIISNDEW